jgi:subtilisin family serine protease
MSKPIKRALFALALAYGLMTEPGFSQQTGTLTNSTVEQLNAIDAAKQTRTPAQKKISAQLLNVIKLNAGAPQVAGAGHLNASPLTSVQRHEDKVDVKIQGNISNAFQSFIEAQGGQITAKLPEQKVMTAKVPISKIEMIASRPEVKAVTASQRPMRNSTPAPNPEGDAAHGASNARTTYQATGSGVKVCVISDSVTGLEAAKANGSLGDVQIPTGEDGVGLPDVEGEGTAMLEIIHRIAPGAALGFATGYKSDVGMAANIGKLANAGCNIIVDDITYPDESPFQDGVIAQAVNAVSARGVLYFSSAANSGNAMHKQSGTWEGDFHAATSTPITLNGNSWLALQFAPGQTKDLVTGIDDSHLATLFWNDPKGAATNEYDIYVLDSAGDIVTYSNTDIEGTQDPVQTVSIQQGESLLILQKKGAKDRFLHLDTNRSRLQTGTTGSTRGHNASGAANAFTVAAISAAQRSVPFTGGPLVHVEDFSSDGPRRIFYDPAGHPITPHNLTHTGGKLLNKPDITAADCITTDVPGFAPFCGTSAAAPHAAAIAALLKGKYPRLTPAQLRKILTSTALDIETPGWDEATGFGIVMADTALAAAAKATRPPAVARNATKAQH